MELFSDLMCRRSSVPLRMSFTASWGRSRSGVFREKPYFSQMAVICQKIMVFLYLPRGAIPPSWMDMVSSGMIFARSMRLTSPRPLHSGHAPSGELNEKLWGAGSR
jgi:hypothetical protein